MRVFALATGRRLVGAVVNVGGLVRFVALVSVALPPLVLTSVFAGAVSSWQAANRFLCVPLRFPVAVPYQLLSGAMHGPLSAL